MLKKFEIRKEQIYSITCDNAANMIKLVKLMNDNQDETIIPNSNLYGDVDDDDEFEYENEGLPISDDNIENELFNNQTSIYGIYIIYIYIYSI